LTTFLLSLKKEKRIRFISGVANNQIAPSSETPNIPTGIFLVSTMVNDISEQLKHSNNA
jgi:CRISPR/Cas system endoribonuclease Cas6 (RAMP superfamily)